MKNAMSSPWVSWPLRGLLALALVLGLAAAAVAPARAEFGFATVRLLAPGAPAGAFAHIQWQQRNGTWSEVAGWQGMLETAPGATTPFAEWAVYPEDYGRGPFRWVVNTSQGGSVWATSPTFFLPDGDGALLALTLQAPAATTATNARTGSVMNNFATITVDAPGAPAGAWVGVQWRDQLGKWHNVEGWQAALQTSPVTGQPYKQWGVAPKDFGNGPFRWVISTAQGGTVLGTSPRFFLPNGAGADLTMTVLPQIASTPADVLTAEMPSAPATLNTTSSSYNLSCAGSTCDFSVISISVPNVPAGSLVGVQWADPMGIWHDVTGWQGSLDAVSGTTAYKQWTIANDQLGQGPFRWVIYNQLGDTVLGITPSFMLPDRAGVNLNVVVPQSVSDIAG